MQEQFRIQNSTDNFSGTTERFDLPELSLACAEIISRWYRYQSPLTIRAGNLNLQIRPQYTPVPEHDRRNMYFILSWQEIETRICLDRRVITRLLETLHEEIDFDALAPVDQALLIEFLFSPAIEKFENDHGPGISLSPDNRGYHFNRNEVITGQVHITGSEITCPFHITLPQDNLDILGNLLNDKPVSYSIEQEQLEEAILLPLSLNYKCMEINLGTLKNLDTGDIILLGSAERQGPLMEITAGNRQLWVGEKIAGQNAVKIQGLQQNILMAANSKEYNKGNSNMSDNSAVIDDIPLVLAFEVGRKDISVSDLRNLQEGSVVSFSGDDSQEVQLVINGKEVGWGTLVRVGDDIGVKIERIFVNG